MKSIAFHQCGPELSQRACGTIGMLDGASKGGKAAPAMLDGAGKDSKAAPVMRYFIHKGAKAPSVALDGVSTGSSSSASERSLA